MDGRHAGETTSAWKMGEIARLRRENAELRGQLAEARARADSTSDHKVHIIPEGLTLGAAIVHVRGDSRPGDILRFAKSGTEFVLTTENGWVPVPR